MKKLVVNIFLILLSFLSVVVSSIYAISCSGNNNGNSINNKNYDYGITTNTINSLNYVTNANVKQILPNLVQGLVYETTSDKKIRSRLNLDKEKMSFNYYSNVEDKDDEHKVEQNKPLMNSLTKYSEILGTSYGSLINNTNYSAAFLSKENVDSRYFLQDAYAGAFVIGNKHKWQNGDLVRPEDYADYLKYIFDINSGSQLVRRLLEVNIKNSRNFYNAQIEYQTKFSSSYKDPWGWKNGWEQQNPNDKELRNKIKKYAQNFGVFTGKDFEDKIKNSQEFWNDGDTKTQKLNLIKKSFYEKFISDSTDDIKHGPEGIEKYLFYDVEVPFDFYSNITNTNNSVFYPINRKFVESVGGISKFGNSIKNFLGNSYYEIEDLKLSNGGYIILKKDHNYFKSGWTLTNKIKVFFENDPNVSASLFRDNYVSYAKLPNDYLPLFWSDKKLRVFMSKNQGSGTQAIQLNLEKTKNSELNNPNLRKAISFFINRADLANISQNSYGTVVTKFSSIGSVRTKNGIKNEHIEDFYKNQTYQPYKGSKKFPIQNFDNSENQSSKYSKFESLPRYDSGHNFDVGKYFLNKYKKDNPNKKNVKLIFIFNADQRNNFDIALHLRNLFKTSSNDFIKLETKGYSSSIYTSMQKSGKFDLNLFNFDFYGNQMDSYIKRFDEVDELSKNKNQGFFDNPSGSWTYKKWLNNLNENEVQDVKDRLEITEENWSIVTEIIENPKIWDYKFQDITNDLIDAKKFELIIVFEKIIRDQAVIIPVFEVDNYWSISKIKSDSLYVYNLQLAYDITQKPLSWLPD